MIDWHLLKTVPFFRGCSEEQLRGLARACRRRCCGKWERIHEAGTPSKMVYVVLTGEVVVQKETAPHHEPAYLSVVVVAGELFGFGEMMANRYYTSATALTACALLEITKEDFLRDFMAIASLREKVLAAFSDIVRILMNKVACGGRDELALYLYQLSEKSGKRARGKIHIQEKVRQPEIASVLNLSREHVTRLFARLRAEKAVQFNRGFPIIDQAWLEQAVKDKDLAASIRYRASPL